MRKRNPVVLLVGLLLLSGLLLTNCALIDMKAKRSEEEYKQRLQNYRVNAATWKDGISQAVSTRGYMTLEELNEVSDAYTRYNTGEKGYLKAIQAQSLLIETAESDQLPFKAMFYLALEKENYDEAELIRRNWVTCLNTILQSNDLKTSWLGEQKKINSLKINYQLEKLTRVIGLTDPMLVNLRKEMMTATKEKKWDDVQKIQNIIIAKEDRLRPPPPPAPQIIYRNGQTVVVQPQQPSEQHIIIEQVPRYGAEDVGRAVSLLNGKGGRLTDKQTGALRMFDILMGR